MKEFEVGKVYEWYARDYVPFIVVSRTEKTITVISWDYDKHLGAKWRMRIKKDDDGTEWVTDSAVPIRYRDSYTSCAKFVADCDHNAAFALWKYRQEELKRIDN